MSAKGWRGVAVGGACFASLLAILLVEVLGLSGASLGSLAVLPVAAAAWLLPNRGAIAVAAVALLVRVFGVFGGLDPVTAGAEIAMLVIAAGAVRVSAELLIRWSETEADWHLRSVTQAAMTEREQIGAELHSMEMRLLFAATLKLEAALTLMTDDSARPRVQGALADLDGLLADLRREVFARSQPPSDSLVSSPTPIE